LIGADAPAPRYGWPHLETWGGHIPGSVGLHEPCSNHYKRAEESHVSTNKANSIVRHLPSPALVVASIALVVALGGVSYAAVAIPKNSVGSAQVRNGSLQSMDLSKKAAAALRGAKGAQGIQGVPGPQGPKGDSGAQGIQEFRGCRARRATRAIPQRGPSLLVSCPAASSLISPAESSRQTTSELVSTG
jgi:hypothetical protein